ncbi:MAG: hypothetical protein SFW64_04835 [Alphaproteobacteria bacterium]|nr:hypothetical protein [Alphaproteobacteria bacterium]
MNQHAHHHEPQATVAPNRGTIILDASTIFYLAHPIDAQFVNPSHYPRLNSYLDLLPLLAKNGFRILIPEVVAIEAGDMLADGRELERSPYNHKPSDRMRAGFLKSVARGHCPNISIVTNTGPKGANTYCQSLRIAVDLARISEQANLKNMLKGIKTHSNTKNLGDQAIMAMLESEKYAQEGIPTLVMTDDRDLAIQAEKRGVQSVDTRSFLHNLVYSRLAAKMGLITQINGKNLTGEDLFEDTYKKIEHRPQQDTGPWKTSQLEKHITNAFLRNLDSLNARPFARALVALKKDLDAQTVSVEAPGNIGMSSNPNGNGGASRIDRFKARYGQRDNGNGNNSAGNSFANATTGEKAATISEGFNR